MWYRKKIIPQTRLLDTCARVCVFWRMRRENAEAKNRKMRQLLQTQTNARTHIRQPPP
jgi:hypothetical protein